MSIKIKNFIYILFAWMFLLLPDHVRYSTEKILILDVKIH